MRFASSITAADEVDRAVDELLAPMDGSITPGMVDLALLFVSSDFRDELETVADRVGERFPGAVLLGCTAEGTIGHDQELERVASMSLLAASMPDVEIRPFYLRQQDLETLRTTADWERSVGVSPESRPVFIALGDPFRFAIHDFVERLNHAYPGAPLVGGMASAGVMPRQNQLLVAGDLHREGIAGVALTGAVAVDTVVSQGCRPIGKPFVITKGDRNVIRDLGGKAPLEQLRTVLADLRGEDEHLARESLFLGRVIDEYQDRFGRGDFLIHNIIGVDRDSGAVAIAGHARVGATVQFHVRDAASADQDLRALLERYVDAGIRGALLFGCNGRGTRMWPEPGHDVSVVREILGDIPVAGFFCSGEFGPVGGRNFVHGFTASIALFRPPEPD